MKTFAAIAVPVTLAWVWLCWILNQLLAAF